MSNRLAVRGGEKAVRSPFPRWPVWNESEAAAVEKVVKAGVWGVHGENVPEFARQFAAFQGVRHVVPVFNGTVAIDLAIEALGIKPGDEVIVPDYTFMATASAPMRRGATVVLVDVDRDTFCLDPEKLEGAITSRTKAVLPVHFGGHPCDMDRIMEIANRRGLGVIEDCAHAHGARWKGKAIGGIGSLGTFSFQSSKTLSCGEGGAVVTNSDALYNACWSLHNCGRHPGEPDYNHYLMGTNYRISEFQTAILLAQLAKFKDQCVIRDRNGKLLTDLLSKIDGIRPQKRAPGVERHGHYLFTFVLEADVPREKFKAALKAEGVPVQLEYPAIHTLEFMKKAGMDRGTFPVADLLAQRSVWLYHEALLGTEEQIHQIADAVRKILENRRDL